MGSGCKHNKGDRKEFLRQQVLPDRCRHFINGRYVDSADGEAFKKVLPAYNESWFEVATGGASEVDAAVTAAEKAAAGPWSRTSPQDRARILRRVGDLIEANVETLALAESLDSGKPYSETLNGDIPRSAKNFHFFADLAAHQSFETWTGEDGSQHTSIREPLGVTGLITPWNLPLYLATWKLAPALAQGNTVILKPAELTPLTATLLCELLGEAGIPEGVVNVVHGFGAKSAGEALVRHPGVKAISFTGETTTGSAIMRDAADGLKKLSFELGGKGASVIFDDADLDLAVPTACRAAFRNQGQICLAGSRLIVHEKIATQVIDRLLENVKKIKIGDPLDDTTTMGALIANDHRDKIAGFVEYARGERVGEILCGGKIPAGLPAHLTNGAFYEPTVIADVPQDSRLIQEEIFGPVLTVQTFKTLEEAIALTSGVPYGLSCSVYTRDGARAQKFARSVRMGMVWINGWFIRDLHTAFGGMKRSGIGREGGRWSLDFFSEYKTITVAGV
ncbi:aldehyde dehydrogenase [bacterium]|nr:aldehyde dehydrogenase [bacterium]